jgi:capsular polysaccharide export protein
MLVSQASAEGIADRCALVGPKRWARGLPVVPRDADPWFLAGQASELRGDAGHDLSIVSALLGRSSLDPAEAVERWVLAGRAYRDPFDGKPIDPLAAIGLLAEWRDLIDSNRTIHAIYGVARWKRTTLDAALWPGEAPPRYAAEAQRAVGSGRVLAWKTRTAPATLARLEEKGAEIGELEDGFIRSSGLGANCVPPLSVIVDFHGAHFDPAQPSGLELLLQDAEFSPEILARAAALRERLVSEGISKYASAANRVARPADPRRRVLATGQVEDDRAVICGGCGCTNLDLVRRAREFEPDACLIYKPHPDVEAGHRKGHVPDAEILRHADEIDRTSSIAELLDRVDALHVITSLAGFEALMRGKQVTTHGAPFYAGWGLTRDLGPVPTRRSRRRSLDELVAATLILYPRYLDPVTRLPCPVEVLVERMAAGRARVTSPLVRLREAQGRLNLLLKSLKGTVGLGG